MQRDLRDSYDRAGERRLTIYVSSFSSGDAVPLAVGNYPITHESPPPVGLSSGATFETNDGQCHATAATSGDAASGSVTLTSIGKAGYQGSYDLTFANGDHVTGTFTTADCYGYTEPPAGGAHSCK